MIKSKIVLDSVAPSGVRLTTFILKYPRFIHAEFMTHRVFSRNASSSRAIPTEKIIAQIEENWARPLAFQKNKRGMQGGEELKDSEQLEIAKIWEQAKNDAIKHAKAMKEKGAHKQHVNRILEPFSFITVVVTATDWANFFALRDHPMAQPEICALAKSMLQNMKDSVPKNLGYGDWHLPFVDTNSKLSIRDQKRTSVAKCARVSYNNHDGSATTIEQDMQLYDRLLGSKPIHASPAEHQAMAIADCFKRSGNFRGWVQYRKTLEDENVSD